MRRMTSAFLTERGFVVDAAARLIDARDALSVTDYDAVVLDLGLPDGEGLALLSGRSKRPFPPVIILTARDAVADRISTLNQGADDYLTKPFELGELEARLRAILRRPGHRAKPVLSYGAVRFDTASQEAFVFDRALDLRRRETLLLESLLSAPGRAVARDILVERIYRFNEPVTSNALEAVAYRLRRALSEADADVVLESRRGVGYRLGLAI